MRFRAFRISIPATSLVKYDGFVWARFLQFLNEHREQEMVGEAYKDPISGAWVLTGSGSSRMVTLLLAAARGDDLTPILDKYERQN